MERGQQGCRGRAGRAAVRPAWPPLPGLNPPPWPLPRMHAAVGGVAEGWAMPGFLPAPPPGCRDAGGGVLREQKAACVGRGDADSQCHGVCRAVHPRVSGDRLGDRGSRGTRWSGPWAGAGWSQAADTSGQRAAGTPAGQRTGIADLWGCCRPADPDPAAHTRRAELQLPLAPAGW